MSGRVRVSGLASLLGAFLAGSLVIGLLSAGLAMPAVGALGATTRAGVDLFDSLPSEFTASPLSQQSKLLNADGSVLATLYEENRIIVPLSEISPIMRQAQVAIEDHRFYEHGGLDMQAVIRAFVANASAGDVTGGGSTLTQQYVKLTLQENALQEGDASTARAVTAQRMSRKIQELKYAIQLEKTLTKDQILEGYLNLAYYGDRAYGVEAAAQHYFSKSAKDLTLVEAALIAGLAQNPGTTDPVNYPERAEARRNVVLDRMHELNIITEQEWTQARQQALASTLKVKETQPSCAASSQPYFCDYVVAWLKRDPSLDSVLGTTEQERTKAIYRGGLTIQTTLDPRIQQIAQEEIERRIPTGNDAEIGAATAVVEPKTGQVKAIAQNTTYKVSGTTQSETTVNWAVDTKYGGSLGFGFGSTVKAFALVTALEKGLPTTASVYAKAASPSRAATYTPADLPGECGLKSSWQVRNDESAGGGYMPLVDATARSINTAFVGLAGQVGVCEVRDTEYRMGLHQSSGEELQAFPAAVILGSDSVSPMTVASAYGTLAADGVHCEPIPVISMAKGKKELPYQPDNCDQRVDTDVARGVTSMLTNVLTGKGTGRASALDGGRPAAGKTGTTDGNNETWFVGYTPELATAVWVGTPNDEGNSRVLDNVCIRAPGESSCRIQRYPVVFGASVAAPTWKQIMDRSLEGVPNSAFPTASDKILYGDKIPIPAVRGKSVDEATALLEQAGFRAEVSDSQYANYRPGVVVTSSPTGTAARGTLVRLIVSKGPAPQPEPSPTEAPPPDSAPPEPAPPEPAPAEPAPAAAAAPG